MSHKAERLKRKALLLSQIQQQRLDLTAARRDWVDATGVYDRGWNTFLSLRSWALVGSSFMAVWSVRHPSVLMRWAKRGLGLWSVWRLIKSTLDQQR
ncbi:YqjK-like family protein [Citrobacter sp. BDA59-3]|uniref:YqjK-like family protein n=1 Tax=Citrobacter sp. BDA59-3 TaxID=2781952 RepID=UPI0018814499|nr:YqjK-like family protein [Citrobacter sp. BDA59-3]QOV68256.1 YqjK-like family protein [Citrobacter sp. BDA59-3]